MASERIIDQAIAAFEVEPGEVGFYLTPEQMAEIDGDITKLPRIQREHTIIYDALSGGFMIVAGDLLKTRVEQIEGKS